MANAGDTPTGSGRGQGGIFGWVARTLGIGQASQAPAPAKAKKASAATGGAAAGRISTAQRSAVAAQGEVAEPLSTYAQALGIEVLEPAPLGDLDASRAKHLLDAVREHFAKASGEPVSLPSASLRVLNLVAQTEVEMGELTRTVSQDPAITAAVLRVANSAALARSSGEVRTVREAVLRLGVTEVGRVAGAVAARALFSPRAKAEQALFASYWTELHLNAASAASGSAHLAMQLRRGRSDYAFLGGMLHDVGKSVALSTIAGLVLSGKAPSDLEPQVLSSVLEDVHVEIGAEVHQSWSLPEYLIALCASHHDAVVPATDEYIEVHVVRVVSGLLALRASPMLLARGEELMQSLQVLKIQPLQFRALDTELRTLGKHMQGLLGATTPAR